MTAQVVIDLNVRLGGNQTFVGFEDVTGTILVGGSVEVFEPESDVRGLGVITEIDAQRQLVFLAVEWSDLRRADAPTTPPVGAALHGEALIGVGLEARFQALIEQFGEASSTSSTTPVQTVLCTEPLGWGLTPHLPGGAYLPNPFRYDADLRRKDRPSVALEVK